MSVRTRGAHGVDCAWWSMPIAAMAEWTVEKTPAGASIKYARKAGDRVSHSLGHQADSLAFHRSHGKAGHTGTIQ